jgi:hypothetical protein
MIDSRQFRWMIGLRDESAQVLPWLVLLVALFLGVGGLCVDLGHAYIVQRQLQASTDAAALAGGYALASPGATTTTATAAAKTYSSLTGDNNATPSLPSVTFSDSFKCVSSVGIPCTATTGLYNAIQVTQTSTITTFLIQVLNIFKAKPMTSMTISVTSTAAMRGSVNSQYNVALVIDTTGSMGSPDADGNCSADRIVCAQEGMQTLLQSLTPCAAGSKSGTCTPFDSVSIFTYPNVDPTTVSDDYTCTTNKHGQVTEGTPSSEPYATPSPTATSYAPGSGVPTYQIVGFSDDYSSTNKAGGALSTTSDLAIAAGASGESGCPGMQSTGGQGTYFAGAIYAALAALNAEQVANPGSLNALIVLSDGDANAVSGHISATDGESLTTNGTYPSLVDQCQQAITAAKSASSSTTVYTIAYGANTQGWSSKGNNNNAGCATDTTGSLAGISPCTALQDMATSTQDFYTDKGTSCSSPSTGGLALGAIFSNIASSFTVARLIPNNST